MTVTQFLSSLQNAGQIQVVIQNENNETLVKLFADGYEQLLATLLARTIEKVTITSTTSITVVLAAE